MTESERGREDAFAGRSLLGTMLRIAAPLSLSAAVRYAVDLVNAYWVGKLGVVALSIVTALGTFLSLSKMFAGLTSAGTSAVVGRIIGEGRTDDAVRLAQKVTAIGVALGAVVALGGYAVSGLALDALSYDGAARAEAQLYLNVLMMGLPFTFGLMSVNGVLVGLGQPRASMIASTASFVVDFALTPLLIMGFHSGVWGSAIAQSAADLVGYVVGMRAIHAYAGTRNAVPWRDRFKKLGELWPVFKVGAPLTADAVIYSGVWFGLIAFLSKYGSDYVAAQGTEERIVQILNVPTDGIAPAAATLVGYKLGQGKKAEAKKVVVLAIGIVATVGVLGGMFLRAAPAPVIAWICNDPSFVDVGVQVMAIAALGLVFLGGRDVFEASFGGVGNTIPPVLIGLVIALTRFPLAYLLAVKMGLGGYGVTWAVNATIMVQTVVLGMWFFLRFARMTRDVKAPSDDGGTGGSDVPTDAGTSAAQTIDAA